MKVTRAEYVISAMSPAQFPLEGLPEIALAGRSNVGKSSLINAVIKRRNLARTSGQPGKTRALNFYRINDSFYFVDLPGYGFARVSQSIKKQWAKLIEGYLKTRECLRLVIQVVDLRHPPTGDDKQMYSWLKVFQIPTVVAATKADKISRGRYPSHLRAFRTGLEMDPRDPLIAFSAVEGTGLEELRAIILETLGNEHTGQD
ncbi:MAG TPA: YihA family ribosome biogenesis GTP-binding protein [Clostridia bacterium]|nr:YihA family ribosome biogenesis GTP-binding protein [Clostridia bacterium]